MIEDFRFATRVLLRSPAYSLVALVTLALGIGATVAIFSAVYAVLLAPLPYPDPDALVVPVSTNAARGFDRASVPYASILSRRSAPSDGGCSSSLRGSWRCRSAWFPPEEPRHRRDREPELSTLSWDFTEENWLAALDGFRNWLIREAA